MPVFKISFKTPSVHHIYITYPSSISSVLKWHKLFFLPKGVPAFENDQLCIWSWIVSGIRHTKASFSIAGAYCPKWRNNRFSIWSKTEKAQLPEPEAALLLQVVKSFSPINERIRFVYIDFWFSSVKWSKMSTPDTGTEHHETQTEVARKDCPVDPDGDLEDPNNLVR